MFITKLPAIDSLSSIRAFVYPVLLFWIHNDIYANKKAHCKKWASSYKFKTYDTAAAVKIPNLVNVTVALLKSTESTVPNARIAV